MTEDQALALTSMTGALVLVGSSLILRRLPAGTLARLVLTWLAIYLGAFLILRAFPRTVVYFT